MANKEITEEEKAQMIKILEGEARARKCDTNLSL